MHEVAAHDAQDKFSQLLDIVENGGEVAIVRDGREVARLVPAGRVPDRSDARNAVVRLRARAEQAKLGPFEWSEWKTFRDEGRR